MEPPIPQAITPQN